MSNYETNLKKIKEYSEILLLSVTFLYVIGFVIVTSFSVKYGIHLEDFFSTKYLAASISYLLSISIFLFVRLAVKIGETSKKIEINPKGTKWAFFFVYVVWVSLFGAHPFKKIYFSSQNNDLFILNIALLFLVIIPFLFYNEKTKNKRWLFPIPQVLFISFFCEPEFSFFIFWNTFILFAGYKLIKHFLFLKKQERSDILFRFDKAIQYLMFLILIITSTTGFGYMTYEVIPRYLGGGKPLKVSIYINETKRKIYDELGVKFQNNGWTENLELIYRDRYSIYLKEPEPFKFSSMEIKLDNVENIKYIGDYKLTVFEMVKEIFKYKDYLKNEIVEMLKYQESGEKPILNKKVLGNIEGVPLLIIYNILGKPDKFQEAVKELQEERKIKLIYDDKMVTQYIDYVNKTNPVVEYISMPVTENDRFMWSFVSLESKSQKLQEGPKDTKH